MSVLEVRDLHAFYGKSHILHGVSLEVREGELVTLLGRNGAGKSTTLRALMGLMRSMKGSVKIFGEETSLWAPFRISGSGVGYERKGNKGRQLSGGEQEMLAIGRALLLNPKLLFLDEPSQGLAPLIVRDVFDVVVKMRNEGMSVLLVEQNVRGAVEIADRAYVLDDGRVVYEGPAAEFAKDEERVRALAGASAEKWEDADH